MSAWVETETTASGPRYRVKWTLGGRGARRRYGGSFARKTDANTRAAWIRSQLAAMQVPDLRLVEPAPVASASTLAEVAERWQASRVDVAGGGQETPTR